MKNVRIGIIGLGYVGLPLACLFSSKYPVIGYDINTERINDLRGGNDYTLEVKQEALKAILIEGTNEGKGLYPSNNLEDLHECNIYNSNCLNRLVKHILNAQSPSTLTLHFRDLHRLNQPRSGNVCSGARTHI